MARSRASWTAASLSASKALVACRPDGSSEVTLYPKWCDFQSMCTLFLRGIQRVQKYHSLPERHVCELVRAGPECTATVANGAAAGCKAYLIQDEHFRFPDERSRKGYALPLASGKQLVSDLHSFRQAPSVSCLILVARMVSAKSFACSAQLPLQLRQSINLTVLS